MEILNKIEGRLKDSVVNFQFASDVSQDAQGVATAPYVPSIGFYNSEADKPLHSINIVNQNANIRKESEILAKFDKSWNENAEFVQKWDVSFVKDLFKIITSEIIQLDARNIVVEITPDESVMVKSDLQEKRLYIELFLTDEEPLNYDIVVNLFKNKNHLFGTAGSAQKVKGEMFSRSLKHS